jgi:hypothetical protein
MPFLPETWAAKIAERLREGRLRLEQAKPAAVYSTLSDEPEFTCTMVASVQQRIAFGERARQHVGRMYGVGYAGGFPYLRAPAVPVLTGCRCTLTPMSRRIGMINWNV